MKKQYIAPISEKVYFNPIMDFNPGAFDPDKGGGGLFLKGSGASGSGVGGLSNGRVIV